MCRTLGSSTSRCPRDSMCSHTPHSIVSLCAHTGLTLVTLNTLQALRAGAGQRGKRDCCPTPAPSGGVLWKDRSTHIQECGRLSTALHDLHREGCGSHTSCIHAAGLTPRLALGDAKRQRGAAIDVGNMNEERSQQNHRTLSAVAPPPLPTWRRMTNREAQERLERLQQLGYVNCTAAHDDNGGKCLRGLKPAAEWMRWFWSAEQREQSRSGSADRNVAGAAGGIHLKTAAGSEHDGVRGGLSWWRPSEFETKRAAVDEFDVAAWLLAMEQLAEKSYISGAWGSAQQKAPSRAPVWYVSFVGDSTVRQQAVSLCCLLSAGGRLTRQQSGGASSFTSGRGVSAEFYVDIDRSVPQGKLRCNVRRLPARIAVAARGPSFLGGRRYDPADHHAGGMDDDLIGVITFRRTYRMDTLSPARPSELSPRLPLALQVALSAPCHVLVVGPGGWEFEEGCIDRHTLHDGLCNERRGNTLLQRRPWILSDFVKRWALVLEAINTRFGDPSKRASTVVVVRTPTPRDFEPVDVMQGGRCERLEPIRESEMFEGKAADSTSMRFAELSKAALLAALVTERAPWVRLLDAYAISRLRADSHLGETRGAGGFRCAFTGLKPPCCKPWVESEPSQQWRGLTS